MARDEVQLGLFEAEAEDSPEAWNVRYSKRARRLSIQVFPHGGVEVVAPLRASAGQVQEFVSSHADWIEQARARMVEKVAAQGPLLPESIELTLLNRRFEVHYDFGDKAHYKQHADRLDIVTRDSTPTDCWPVLRRWLRETAKQELPERLKAIGERIGLQPSRVQVRNQKTRWGSCSSKGTISLNAAILLLDQQQADYVMIHELCHLQHLNHSRRFWGLVESHMPDYESIDQSVDEFWLEGPVWLR